MGFKDWVGKANDLNVPDWITAIGVVVGGLIWLYRWNSRRTGRDNRIRAEVLALAHLSLERMSPP
jgi:hypothetical protein